MAEKKPASRTKKQTSKSSSRKLSAAERAKKKAEIENYLKRRRKMKGIIILLIAFLLLLLFIIPGEKVTLALHQCFWGLFGFLGFMLPVIIGYCAAQLLREKPAYRFKLKAFFFSITVLTLATSVFCFTSAGRDIHDYGTELINCFRSGSSYMGTGFLGGLLGIPLTKLLGSTGSGLISLFLFVISALVSLEAIFINILDKVKRPVKEKIEDEREIHNRIRETKKELQNEKRRRQREDYIEKKVEKRVNSLKQKNENSENYRRLRKSSFYAADETQKEETQKETASKKKSKKLDDMADILPEVKDKKQKKKKQIPKSAENYDFVSEDTPVFADDLDFGALVGSFKKKDYNSESLIPPVFDDADKKQTKKDEISKLNENKPEDGQVSDFEINTNSVVENNYIKPPFTLLEPQPIDDQDDIAAELQHNGKTLVDTLKSFNIQATITNISRGPSVTRYELQPAAGVKISKITNLSDDIAMNLAAMGVRIEAPIPGKNAIGIEVPNKYVSIVKMRELVESKEFQNAKSKLTVALGVDITGRITLADLGKMPHLLIAGSTGSGKSVCINSMLVSLLYKADPDEVKLILIDPKVVELGVYNGIPHLLVPVVTDPRKAAGALNWAVNEMLERYKTFAEYGVRDMHGYNRMVDKQNSEYEEADYEESERSFEEDEMLAQAQSELSQSDAPKEHRKLQKMAHIVIVIDELADLMMAAPNEVEESICRLAQMARAAGMHLVIATQRPSVDVITGLIKANIPSRIAFAVKSGIDSRTILDTIGAEKLLGRGDMLYAPIGKTKPERVQGCFVDDNEIENIITFIKNNKMVEYDKNVIDEIEKNALPENNGKDQETEKGDMDPMMEEAIKCVVEAGQASTSLLQRRLRLGYARAGRLIDEMEQMGIVGPHEGSKPRQVLMSYQQWLERNMTKTNDE